MKESNLNILLKSLEAQINSINDSHEINNIYEYIDKYIQFVDGVETGKLFNNPN